MNVGQLRDILEKYERNTDVVVSLGPDEPELLHTLTGVREGVLIEGARRIKNKSSQTVFYPPRSTQELPSVAILLA